MTGSIIMRKPALRAKDGTCSHQPRCPDAIAPDRIAARPVAPRPEQGWSLLCNGVVLFDDGGQLLPDGRAIYPAPACTAADPLRRRTLRPRWPALIDAFLAQTGLALELQPP